MSKQAVMLRNNWPGDFRRGGLVFKPGEPQELTAKQFKVVEGDIGHALVEVEYDDRGKPRVVDYETEAEIANQGEQIAALERQLSDAHAAIDLLIEQVKKLGVEPVVDFTGDSATETLTNESV